MQTETNTRRLYNFFWVGGGGHKENNLETTTNSNIKLRFQYSINYTVLNKAPML